MDSIVPDGDGKGKGRSRGRNRIDNPFSHTSLEIEIEVCLKKEFAVSKSRKKGLAILLNTSKSSII